MAANATSGFPASAGPKGGIVPQLVGDGARDGSGRREESQPGAQGVPLLLLQQVAPDPERFPPVGAAVRQDYLPFGTQVMLELLELGRLRALQFHVVRPFQNEGRFFTIGCEKGTKRTLGLAEGAAEKKRS